MVGSNSSTEPTHTMRQNVDLSMPHTKEQAREYRRKNPEKFRAYRKKWREERGGKEYMVVWNAANRDRVLLLKRDKRLFKTFGITVADYDAMLAKQGGVCAICRLDRKTKKRLHVDHCHVTGRIRGILCHYCNTAIGALREDPVIFAAAVTYLREAA